MTFKNIKAILHSHNHKILKRRYCIFLFDKTSERIVKNYMNHRKTLQIILFEGTAFFISAKIIVEVGIKLECPI